MELLMVVGVVALLAALLLPALGKAKTKAQSLQCRSNLRQLEPAGRLYADEHGDYFPPNREAGIPATGTAGAWVLGNAQWSASLEDLRKGELWRYAGKSLGVYKCPADRSRIALPGVSRPPRSRSYSLQGILHDRPGPPWSPHPAGIDKYGQVGSPSAVFSFLCEGENTIGYGGFWCIEITDWAVWYNIPAVRHGGGGSLAFLDGHVEPHRWKYPGRERSITGFLNSPVRASHPADREDLMWLVERTAYWYWPKRNPNGPHF